MNVKKIKDFLNSSENLNQKIYLSMSLTIIAYIFMIPSSVLMLTETPYTIFDFQLSFTSEKARIILNSWVITGIKDEIIIQTLVDYFFLAGYSITLALFIKKLENQPSKTSKHNNNSIYIYIALFSGVLDAIENIFTLWVLFDINTFPNSIIPLMSSLSAIKFICIIISITKIIIMLSINVRNKLKSEN